MMRIQGKRKFRPRIPRMPSVFESLIRISKTRGAGYFVLIDPDKSSAESCRTLSKIAASSGADAILVGGSSAASKSSASLTPTAPSGSAFSGRRDFDRIVRSARTGGNGIPVIIFPGSEKHVSKHADAMLFTSLVSGRNPEYLIGEQVRAAPRILRIGLETIPTGYILVKTGSGMKTKSSIETATGTHPVTAKSALAHALACKYLGFRMIYLEAGSGARHTIPKSLVTRVKRLVGLPLIVGGGIRKPAQAKKFVRAGADFIVTGNVLDGLGQESTERIIKEISRAVHYLQ